MAMQTNSRLNALLSVLSEREYLSLEAISQKLRLSQRTIRPLLNQLEDLLSSHGAALERRRGTGIRLKITDRIHFQAFIRELSKAQIPDTAAERTEFILAQLLTDSEAYFKADWFCEQLFISRKTLSLDLKEAERFLNRHALSIERRPHHGLRIRGSEFSFRLCLSAAFHELHSLWFQDICHKFKDPQAIQQILTERIQKAGYAIYETDLPNLILQIQIALYRIEFHHRITMEETESREMLQESDIRTAQSCAMGLQEAFSLHLPPPEIKYLAIQLLGKKKVLAGHRGNVFIDMEINQLVNQMLENVYQNFKMDLRSDFDLGTALRQHMVSLRIRLQYRLRLENPMLKEIREFYSFPYAVAAQASTILSEYFHTIVPEDEIGYLALCFALSLKQQEQRHCKRNILLVCASGAGSARFFQYRFREVFGDYLNRVEICDAASLAFMDFSNIDQVFSTVPIHESIPVPVCQIQYFFDRHDTAEVVRILKDGPDTGIRRYFCRELFFTGLTGTTREDVLHDLCTRISEVKELPEEFESSVLKREHLMQTDFCRKAAMPHPYQPVTDETFVAVGILDRPIRWYNHEVQIIFLLSVSRHKEDLEPFYNAAPRFMMDEGAIDRLIQERSYETLIEIIAAAESEQTEY